MEFNFNMAAAESLRHVRSAVHIVIDMRNRKVGPYTLGFSSRVA